MINVAVLKGESPMGFFADFWHSMVLKDQTSTDRGYVSAPEQDRLVGRQGTVTRELRPAGTVVIDGEPVDVVSEGDYIEKGRQVTVVAVTGGRVVVR